MAAVHYSMVSGAWQCLESSEEALLSARQWRLE